MYRYIMRVPVVSWLTSQGIYCVTGGHDVPLYHASSWGPFPETVQLYNEKALAYAQNDMNQRQIGGGRHNNELAERL